RGRRVWVTPDSSFHRSAARSLQGGHGLRALDYRSEAPRPLTHFPPAVPTLFALAGWPDRDPVEGARRMNALLFGANIFLVGLAVGARARDWQLPALGSLLALFSPDLLNVHAMAWAEPLFLCASLTALLALPAYLDRPRGSMAPV